MNHTSPIETEVKIYLGQPTGTHNLLARVAAQIGFLGGEQSGNRLHERNSRYEDSEQGLGKAEKTLRLRQNGADGPVILTYKEPLAGIALANADSLATSRLELEVEVSDYATAEQILAKLGYHTAWHYEKYRTTYQLDNCEVVLDELPYGLFLEAEGEATAIEEALAALGPALPATAMRASLNYSNLFFALKQRLGLQARDLSFVGFSQQDPAELDREIRALLAAAPIG
jgi:adenylate cyclase, class 2